MEKQNKRKKHISHSMEVWQECIKYFIKNDLCHKTPTETAVLMTCSNIGQCDPKMFSLKPW